MVDIRITNVLIKLLLILEFKDEVIVAILVFLKGEEQRWQMVLWLHRMMGEELDQKLSFGEVWLQAEKIAAIYDVEEENKR